MNVRRVVAVPLLSGGLDSAVLATRLVRDGYDVHPLSVDYGQRHVRELQFAGRVVDALGLRQKWRIVDISGLAKLLPGSSQTDLGVPVPHGHYTAENMKATVVPNRNMILLALAAARVVALGGGVVAFAAHAGDHAIYPDCREPFAVAVDTVLDKGTEGAARLWAPYLGNTKADIVAEGARLLAPMEHTWSCYEGGMRHCGRCGTCVERREAFEMAGVVDPTEYRGDATV